MPFDFGFWISDFGLKKALAGINPATTDEPLSKK